MKLIAFIKYFLLLTFFCFNTVSAETIQDFITKITIQKDGSIFVSEKIVYDFGQERRHGLFREIPLVSSNGPQLDITVVTVEDANNQAYHYSTSNSGNLLQLKVGDPKTILSGMRTFVIAYRVEHAVRNFKDHDELYWNVTGNQWPVDIQHAEAQVMLPDYSMTNINMTCFTGRQGSVEKNCTFNRGNASINYVTTQVLNVGEGLTLVFGMPLGFVHTVAPEPAQTRRVVVDNTNSHHFDFSWVMGGFFAFYIFIKLFKRRTKKLKPIIPRELKKQAIVTEYNPPGNLSPIIIGAIFDRKVDASDITSVILDLAIRGYLKLRFNVQQRRLLPDGKDFELIRLKDGADLVESADQIVFAFLFDFSKRNSITLNELITQKASIQPYIKQIQENIERTLCKKEYFDPAIKEKKSKQLKICLFSSLVLLFIVPFVPISGGIKAALISMLMLAVIVFAGFLSKLTQQLTQKGIFVLRKILGFREFLQLTEKDKLEKLNAPEVLPETFERFLPYAMVLGVEKEWAKRFEGIYHIIPSWYENSSATSFNSQILARSLREFNGSFSQAFTAPPAPFSKMSSGFKGSSGGGSGGGGGRSW
jgi:uncharacterized membrane protein